LLTPAADLFYALGIISIHAHESLWLVSEAGFRMTAMKKNLSTALAMIAVLGFGMTMLMLAQRAAAQQDDDDGPMSDLRFLVVKDYNGKPIRNAAVVLHPVTRKGKQAMGGMELKTDNDGKTNIDGIPYGPLRVQVLAPGFQTFGEDYEIDRPKLEITVKLKRPKGQYSEGNQAGTNKSQADQKPQ
jgi:Carboxypeptidase regulatory-like domain